MSRYMYSIKNKSTVVGDYFPGEWFSVTRSLADSPPSFETQAGCGFASEHLTLPLLSLTGVAGALRYV